jgi:hypothetical protein
MQSLHPILLQYFIPPFLNIDETILYIETLSPLVQWKDIPYQQDVVLYFYSHLTLHFGISVPTYQKKKLKIIIDLLQNDNKNECSRYLLYNLLFVLIQIHDLNSFEFLVNQYQLDVTFPDNQLLHMSIELNSIAIFHYLVKQQKVIDTFSPVTLYQTCFHKKYHFFLHFYNYFLYHEENFDYLTCFLYAIENGCYFIVRKLVEDSKVNLQEHPECNFVYKAVLSGNFKLVKYLIEDCQLHHWLQDERLIYKACEQNNLSIVEYLFDYSITKATFQCLEIACQKNHIEIVQILIQKGNLHVSMEDDICFVICCRRNLPVLFKILISYLTKEEFEKRNKYFMQIAHQHCSYDILQYLQKINIQL